MIDKLIQFLARRLKWDMASTDRDTHIYIEPATITVSTDEAANTLSFTETSPSVADTASQPLLWDTPKQAYHSTRVICDEIGLTFKQKEDLCACVFQESEFLVNPRPNQNKDLKTGKVWSTDYGIVQVNDYWHIGKGKTFKSVKEVLTNPEKCIRWMAGIMKTTGKLQPWSSYTSGAYKKHLSTGSRMRLLAR